MEPMILLTDYIKLVGKNGKVLYDGKLEDMPIDYDDTVSNAEYLPELSGLPLLDEANYFIAKMGKKIMPETKKEVKSEATCDYEAVVKSLTEQVENLQKENDYIKKQYQALVVDYNRQLKVAGRWFDELERLETAIRNTQKNKKGGKR